MPGFTHYRMKKELADLPIRNFKGKFEYLSNFYPCSIKVGNYQFQSVEAAFQSQKRPVRAKDFTNLNPVEAKRLGKKVALRKDWEQVKDNIMKKLLMLKFQDPTLRTLLLSTKNREIIHENYWGDIYWGECAGVGKNKLGKLLMEIRGELNGSTN